MTIDEILDEVERLNQEATPGPWSVDPISHVYVRHGERKVCRRFEVARTTIQWIHNGRNWATAEWPEVRSGQ